MQDVVRKCRNSAAVRIPPTASQAAPVRLDQPADAREQGARIVAAPPTPARLDHAALVAGVTDDNRHAPIDAGRPAGREP